MYNISTILLPSYFSFSPMKTILCSVFQQNPARNHISIWVCLHLINENIWDIFKFHLAWSEAAPTQALFHQLLVIASDDS